MAVAARGRRFARTVAQPAAINVHLFSGNAPDTVAAIAAQIAALPQPPSDCRCWFGGEAQLVAALRPIARVQWRLPAAHRRTPRRFGGAAKMKSNTTVNGMIFMDAELMRR